MGFEEEDRRGEMPFSSRHVQGTCCQHEGSPPKPCTWLRKRSLPAPRPAHLLCFGSESPSAATAQGGRRGVAGGTHLSSSSLEG